MPARPQNLSDEALATALLTLPGWTRMAGRDAIAKRFEFTDFSHAFGFMTRAALAAERLGHHPEWSNVWNRVDVTLATHDTGGITSLDIALAAAMEAIART